MLKNILLITTLSSVLLAQTASEFSNQQMQSFNEQKKEFGVYKKDMGSLYSRQKD